MGSTFRAKLLVALILLESPPRVPGLTLGYRMQCDVDRGESCLPTLGLQVRQGHGTDLARFTSLDSGGHTRARNVPERGNHSFIIQEE